MHAAIIWDKLSVHSRKVALNLRAVACCVMLVVVSALSSHAQAFKWAKEHNPHYDDRKISYGFMIGLHTSSYQVKYSDVFVTPQLDTVHSVIPSFSAGFSLGFLFNVRLNEFVDFRLMPKAGFYAHRITYYYTNRPSTDQTVETTMVELPMLFKYKSMRRGNVRMYMIGGITPGIEASGKNDVESQNANLAIRKANLSLEGGLGFDFYFPLFKFSQEIRFSRGIVNMLANDPGIYHKPLSRLNTNTISVYFIFQ